MAEAAPHTPYPDYAAAAPGDLETVRRFVNTLDLERHEPDKLIDPAGLADWIAENELDDAAPAVRPVDLRRAHEVREALRQLMLANNGHSASAVDALAVVNRATGRARLGVAFDADGARLEPATTGVDAAIGRLLAIVARAMSDGTWARMKACENETCRWAFYDKSKNQSGRWCTMRVCGNRAKARAFRERRRAD